MSDSTTEKYSLGLFYIPGVLTEGDLSLIEKNMAEHEIEFKRLDKSNKTTASLEYFTNTISFFMNPSLLMGIVSGVIASATWDSIKRTIAKSFEKIQNKKYNKVTRDSTEEKSITFGIEMRINDDNYNFKFNGILSTEIVYEALDKIISLIKEEKSTTKEERILTESKWSNYVATYDETTKLWIVKRADEIIMEKMKEAKANSRKT